jgi:alanine racemase
MPELARAGAVLDIDLDAVAANWRVLRDRVGGAECAAVVKADAYGLGAAAVARALAAAGCRSFFVAGIDEGIEVRAASPAGDVFVLNGPFTGTEGEFAAHRLIPVLNSPEQIAAWSRFSAGKSLPAAIHIDTGMSRLGLTPAETRDLAAHPERLAGFRPVLLMSHLACGEEVSNAMNEAQRTAFAAACAALPAMPASLAASSGIFLGPRYHLDMVRPGAALYGVAPQPAGPNPMAQVVRLQGKIIQVRDVDTPMTVGYGATHRVTRKARIATVAVGYADGFLRSLSNRGSGLLAGVRVPIVGRVSMDLITFDVTGAPADAVHPEAMIELIGPGHTVNDVAAAAGTIGYEILTSLGRRYARRYGGAAA